MSRRLDVPWLAIHERFAAVREAEPGRDLFVADGHCNDDGYELMAQCFAAIPR